jgi:hypothetical protein
MLVSDRFHRQSSKLYELRMLGFQYLLYTYAEPNTCPVRPTTRRGINLLSVGTIDPFDMRNVL